MLEVPTDKPRPLVQCFDGATQPIALPAEVANRFMQLCSQWGATRFHSFLAVWQLLLCAHSGQEDLVVGVPFLGRESHEAQAIVGFFVNMLSLRALIQRGERAPQFAELVMEARRKFERGVAHSLAPFLRVCSEVVPMHDAIRAPIFQTMFLWEESDGAELKSPSVWGLFTAKNEVLEDGSSAKMDLLLSMNEGTRGSLNYCTALYEGSTAVRLASRFVVLLQSVSESKGGRQV